MSVEVPQYGSETAAHGTTKYTTTAHTSLTGLQWGSQTAHSTAPSDNTFYNTQHTIPLILQ